MKAILLAAGQGSRLGAICLDQPKCLVKIEDNSLLEIQINTLHSCGIEDITVVRGYKSEKIDIPGLNYYDNPDYAKTNMLYSLFCAEKELNDDVLILYSDILFEPQVIERMFDSTHDIAAGVMVNWQTAVRQRNKVALEDLEMVYFDSENRVQRIGKFLDEDWRARIAHRHPTNHREGAQVWRCDFADRHEVGRDQDRGEDQCYADDNDDRDQASLALFALSSCLNLRSFTHDAPLKNINTNIAIKV